MSHNWGPHYIVPTSVLKSYSGLVVLRESLDRELLQKELQELRIEGHIEKISNPWYYRKKGTETWVKIGESADDHENFPARWDTTVLENGQYEVMGLMHVFVRKNSTETTVARQNIVEVNINNA